MKKTDKAVYRAFLEDDIIDPNGIDIDDNLEMIGEADGRHFVMNWSSFFLGIIVCLGIVYLISKII